MDAMGLGWVINMPVNNRPLILQKSGGLQGNFAYVTIASARGVASQVCAREIACAGHYLTSARGGKGALAVSAVASGALGDAGKAAEVAAGEFAGEVATGIFFPIRFLADVTTG